MLVRKCKVKVLFYTWHIKWIQTQELKMISVMELSALKILLMLITTNCTVVLISYCLWFCLIIAWLIECIIINYFGISIYWETILIVYYTFRDENDYLSLNLLLLIQNFIRKLQYCIMEYKYISTLILLPVLYIIKNYFFMFIE